MSESVKIQDLLMKKRLHQELTHEELQYYIKSATDETAHPSQIGAMLMAMAINGLTHQETVGLTRAMINSGIQLKWSGVVADKHSTGGVGDKVSIPLAPALAACGLIVPMMSGRGLGHTGGTLDKLESIVGFNVSLNHEQMNKCIDSVGCFIASTTDDICPGDKVLYKHRDVTSTIDVNGLVVASILSKKITEGAKYLILDLKTGSAAFYKTVDGAEELSNLMISVAKLLGVELRCILTTMDEPIGKFIGNSLEIEETIDCLRGNGPKDLIELCTRLGGELLEMSGKAANIKDGEQMILNVLNNGDALKKFKDMCISQGVRPEDAQKLCDQQYDEILPRANKIKKFKASKTGWIKEIKALPLAEVCFRLGSGRRKPDDKLDLSVGMKLLKVSGDQVNEDEEWLEIHYNTHLTSNMLDIINNSIEISSTRDFNVPSRVLKTVY